MKNIIFDLDGTLWDTTEVAAKAWNQAINVVGGTSAVITPSMLTKQFGKPMDEIARSLFSDADEKQREILLRECIRVQHEALEQSTDSLLYPGVIETIQALSAKTSLYIVSNCQSGYIELFMRKTGVERYISDIECFGNTGLSKGENIKLLMERNGLEEAVYAGDTQGDCQAAAYAGIPFVYARYGFGDVERYDWVIDEISELLNLPGVSE